MMYLPHGQHVITTLEKSLGETKDLPWRLLDCLGGCSQITGRYTDAEAMYRQALQIKEMVLGKDHLDTLGSITGITNSLRQQGKHAEAETMYRQMLQVQEAVLGKDHLDALGSMKYLANSLHEQGKYAEAGVIHRQMLKVRETMLGKDHPDTLTSIHNLVLLLCEQGKYAEAEAIRQQAGLKSERSILPTEQPQSRLGIAIRRKRKAGNEENRELRRSTRIKTSQVSF